MGSLGQNEKNVGGIRVRNCTIVGTENGLQIKTWPRSPPSKAFNMTFEDVIMIDPSDIALRNITGSARTTPPVTINCSKSVPCTNVTLEEIDLKKMEHGEHGTSLWSFVWESFWWKN
ncbi:hypothetical protein Ancab_007994 [Ancistrocladus abbreviatus]